MEPEEDRRSESVITMAAKSAWFNIVLQVLLRITSFISNAVVLHYVSKDVIGVINVRLMLLYSTTLCLSREALRRSCMYKLTKENMDQMLNLLWLFVPVSVVMGLCLSCIWLFVFEPPNPLEVPHYATGVIAVLFSVWIEMLAEPLYIIGQSYYFLKLKVITEGISLLLKSTCMVYLVVVLEFEPIHAFCCSQVAFSAVYTMSYYVYFLLFIHFQNNVSDSDKVVPFNSIKDVFPKLETNQLPDWNCVTLVLSFYTQTILKQLLTEGEKYIMTLFNVLSFYEQGIYDVISNLASLPARLIFSAVEDSAYMYFSNMVMRGSHSLDMSSANSKTAWFILQGTMRTMFLIGLLIFTFGDSYSHVFLFLYGGGSLSSDLAIYLMKFQCFYIILLALNGITECFCLAVKDASRIDLYSGTLAAFSTIFLAASCILVRYYGSTGLIIANCMSMVMRIRHSVKFIGSFFDASVMEVLRLCLPDPGVLTVFVMCFGVTAYSHKFIGIGRVLFAFVTAYILLPFGILVEYNEGHLAYIFPIILSGFFHIILCYIILCKEMAFLKFLYNRSKEKEHLD